jgi:hypothetical protein
MLVFSGSTNPKSNAQPADYLLNGSVSAEEEMNRIKK